MALSTQQCQQFNDSLGRRPFNWDKQIAKDRKPHNYLYTGMYKSSAWEQGTGTTHLHEKIYVARPNDPGLWTQFVADPCVGAPCQTGQRFIAHGVDQLRYDRYRTDYRTPVFCIDQLNTIEEGITKIKAMAQGYKEVPEEVCSDFLRQLVLRKAGSFSNSDGGIFLCGLTDTSGNPQGVDSNDNMFAISQGESLVGSKNSLLINLNANGQLDTALGVSAAASTTALLAAGMGKLNMNYLMNCQEDLAANGYHDKEWLMGGKFSMTVDATARRNLRADNPALSFPAADFAEGGAFYSYGFDGGCGDWLFKEDKQQMRFRFRGDLDGKNFSGSALTGAVWIEQVWPFVNVAATYGIKPVFSATWKNAPIRLYHCYNREAREIKVGDITSVNAEMKFGLARSFMGDWKWYSPDVFQAIDPNTGTLCTYYNEKHNMGFWEGEYDLSIKTVFPSCERLILALGEAQPSIRDPRTYTPLNAPSSKTDYQAAVAYSANCGAYVDPSTVNGYQPNVGFVTPVED